MLRVGLRVLVPVGQQAEDHVVLVALQLQLVDVSLGVFARAKNTAAGIAALPAGLDNLAVLQQRAKVGLLAANRVDHASNFLKVLIGAKLPSSETSEV